MISSLIPREPLTYNITFICKMHQNMVDMEVLA